MHRAHIYQNDHENRNFRSLEEAVSVSISQIAEERIDRHREFEIGRLER